MLEVTVVGVRVEFPAQQPIVMLKEASGQRYLPIWIGAVEASAIAFALQGISTERPMTHDLLRDVLGSLATTLTSVRITDLQDGVFFATLELEGPAGPQSVSARPSDAVALAIRTGSPLFADESVLDAAGIVVRDEQENEVEKFREFLDTINPDDFDTGAAS